MLCCTWLLISDSVSARAMLGEVNTRNRRPSRTSASLLTLSVSSYSVRKADIGLIRVARRAGNQVAIKVAAPSKRGAVENAIGSSAPT